MNNKSIHIISFDVPFPADYGGAIDVYYRIKALNELGVKVILHCYEYGRGRAKELEDITEKVYYYSRKKRLVDWFSKRPFIVQTRRSKELHSRLLKDDFPLLFEGVHSTFWLDDELLKKRLKIVRTHNIEHLYYDHLAENTSGIKAFFFRSEAKKLKKYETILNHADHILAISENDVKHFNHFKSEVTLLSPCFNEKEIKSLNSTENYGLFHGNLSVSENFISAKWLIQQVYSSSSLRLVIAGKNPSDELLALANQTIQIIANPSEVEMNALIENARVHVLHTHQSTGVKLKLIRSLQTSGSLIVSPKMVEGTNLSKHCIVVDSPEEWAKSIEEAMKSELSKNDFDKRVKLFNQELNTKKNCENKIVKLLDDKMTN